MSTDMSKELEAQSAAPTLVPDEHNSPLAQLSQTRKNALLLIFSVAQFIDVCNVSGVTVAVAQISVDIALGPSQVVWVRILLSSTSGNEANDRTSDYHRLCVLLGVCASRLKR